MNSDPPVEQEAGETVQEGTSRAAVAAKKAQVVAKEALKQFAKQAIRSLAVAASGWLAGISWGVFGVALFVFIFVLAVSGGTAGELTGVNNPKDTQSGTGSGCGALDDPTTLTAEQIDAYLAEIQSPLAQPGMGASIVAAANEFKVNPALMIGIARAEGPLMGKGAGFDNKNPGNVKTSKESLEKAGIPYVGWDSQGHVIFPDWASGWRGLAEVLRRKYFNEGKITLEQIAEGYLEGNKENWIKNVQTGMGDVCPQPPVPEIVAGTCADAAKALESKAVSFKYSNDQEGLPKGVIKHLKTGENIVLDANLCTLLTNMAQQSGGFRVTCIVCDHPYTSSSGNKSKHVTGQAVDIGFPHDEILAKFPFENSQALGMDEIITGNFTEYNLDQGKPFNFSQSLLNAHLNHTHYSVY